MKKKCIYLFISCFALFLANEQLKAQCSINNLFAEAYDVCNEDGTFNIDVEFAVTNGNNSGFDVYVNQTFFAYFPNYPNPYITLENAALGNGEPVIIQISDNDNPNCTSIFTVLAPICETSACEISNVVADFQGCTPNGVFSVLLDFEYANPMAASFQVLGNGNNYGTFSYLDIPITLNALAGDGETIYEFVVQDIENPNCSAWAAFQEPITCNTTPICNIWDVTLETDCNPNGSFMVILDFLHEGTGTHFDLGGSGGANFGPFSYESLPVVLGPYDGTNGYFFEIVDVENESCFAVGQMASPNCETQNCSISDLFVEAFANCNANGTFDADIVFNYENVNGAGFDLYVNGVFHSFQNTYPAPYITVSDLALGNGQDVVVTVQDNDNLDCIATYTLVAPVCENACEIGEVMIQALDCQENTFAVEISFEYGNVGSDYFTVSGNGINYGTYAYADLPIIIDGLEGNGAFVYAFGVSDNDFPDCTNFGVVTAADCFLNVELRTFMQGTYDETSGLMRTDLRDNNHLPISQPFASFPWNYTGNEDVATAADLPLNMVDWVLISLHNENDNFETIAQRAGFLLNDGEVVDLDMNSGLKFTGIADGNYYLSVKTRNHLAIMSKEAVTFPNDTPHDFTKAVNVLAGESTLINIAAEKYAMLAGDNDGNGIITVDDFNIYALELGGLNDYFNADCNFDDNVTIDDFNLYLDNISAIGVPQIRY